MLAVDISKYTGTVTLEVVEAWRQQGVGLAIIQAHPAGYGQERSLQEMSVLQASGMPWDAYVYQYLGFSDWTTGALETLTLAAAQGNTPRQLWLDVEDVDTYQQVDSETRALRVREDLAALDAWAMEHGETVATGLDGSGRRLVHPTGIYTGRWYWESRMDNWVEFADRELWDSHYDGNADAAVDFVPYGGWTSARIKQYAGTSTFVVGGLDLDVLSIEEANEILSPHTEGDADMPVPQDYRDKFGEDVTWDGVAANLEGIINMLTNSLGTDETKLAAVRAEVAKRYPKVTLIRGIVA